MKVLFVHNNFPAQYRHLAAKLAADPSNLIAAIGSPTSQEMPNVLLRRYQFEPQDIIQTHPFARRFDLECRRAERVLYAAVDLAGSGFRPDIVMVHPGWGESLPLRAVFPESRIVVYCEFYYGATGRDVDFDPEFLDVTLDGRVGLDIKNAAQLLALIGADAAISPTEWQRSTYPAELQHKISVIHEGVDTKLAAPDPNATLITPSGKSLKAGDEVLTYVARDLEPLRGYHVLMRALPRIMKARPKAEIVIVGGEGVSYGAGPPSGTTWKRHFLQEVGQDLDMTRIHFLGNVPYDRYLSVLKVSRVHVYFTYPFVLSWSFLEAMSVGCAMIAGDVPTTRELLDETCGFLLPFSDIAGISDQAIAVLADPGAYQSRRTAARERITRHYDISACALPSFQVALDQIIDRKPIRKPI